MSERGDYRSFYVSFWDDPDVHSLTDRAYRVLTTLKGTLSAAGIGVVYLAQLAERCGGLERDAIEEALLELEVPKPGSDFGWIVRERNVVWIVNALRYEPNLTSNSAKHRTFVRDRLLAPLGNRPIVNNFRRYYIDWFPEGSGNPNGSPSDTHRRANDRVSEHSPYHSSPTHNPNKTDRQTEEKERAPAHASASTVDRSSRSARVGEQEERSETRRDTPPDASRDIPGDVDRFLARHDFGAFRESVAGMIRPARFPLAIVQTLEMHLAGEMGHEPATTRELGLACQQYLTNAQDFNAALFAGFVRRAKRYLERSGNRQRNDIEERRIQSERQDAERVEQEEREADELLARFKAANPDRYAEIERAAERHVPKTIEIGRDLMLRATILGRVRASAAA
jgi:hypothetical protein